MFVFKVLGFLAVALLITLVMLGIFIAIQYNSWFNGRRCKHCHRIMHYKGLREDNDNPHYLFHCPHCGAWEQIPKELFNHEQTDNP